MIDTDKAILSQILICDSHEYENFTGKTSKKTSLKMFQSSFLEYFTKSNAILTLSIVFICILASLCGVYKYNMYITVIQSLFYLSIGVIIWMPSEYFIHKYLFHAKPNNKYHQLIHFIFHGIHHVTPTDKERLVMPPLVTLIFMTSFYNIISYTLYPGDTVCLLCGFGLMCKVIKYIH